MLLQSFKRIIKSDYEQQYQELIDRLGSSINIMFDNLTEAFNKKIDVTNNLACTLKDVPVTVDANGGLISPISFPLATSNVKAIGSSVILVSNITNSAHFPIATPYITFTQSNTNIIINNIQGLRPGDLYTLRIIVWHG